MLFKRTLVPALFLAIAAGAPAYAQQQPGQDDTQQVMLEMQQIQQQLAEIEDRALESDASLQHRQEEVQDLVLAAIFEIDPQLEGHMERLEALQGEFAQAQEAEDMERMQTLMNEAQELQQGFMEAQAEAMERPEVVGAIEGFREDLVKKMHELEPETERLMTRVQELAEKLQDQS